MAIYKYLSETLSDEVPGTRYLLTYDLHLNLNTQRYADFEIMNSFQTNW